MVAFRSVYNYGIFGYDKTTLPRLNHLWSISSLPGSIVLGREERGEVMGRVGYQTHLLFTVYTSSSLFDLSFLHRVPTQPIKLRQLSIIHYHSSVP